MQTDPSRRRLLGAAGLALAGLGATPRAEALGADATAALLRARLQEQGVGLVAIQVGTGEPEITAAGEARRGEALSKDGLFEIGSITKTFTALLLADAVVRKELALDDAVEDALPGGVRLRDAAGLPIRWRDVATHRSGLPRLPTNMAPKDPADPYADYDEARLLDFLRNFKPAVPRDSVWEYSNLGFGLLGYALARRARSTYGDLLAARVLRPLAMTRTQLAVPNRTIAGLVDGHDATRRPLPHWRFDALMGAGALVMDGADLGRYAQAALVPGSSPLGEAFLLAQREHAPGPAAMNPIGLAWIRAPLNGRTVLNHDGATAGFSSSLWLDPERKRAAAVLSNAAVEVKDLGLHVLDESVPPRDFSLTRQAEVALGAEQLAPLAAVYALNPQFKLTISLRSGELWAQASGQGAFQLFAKSPRRFFAKVTPLEIEFDAATPPAALLLMQGGNTLRFVRE